ncbi:MAG: class I SAM-dependent methyltransferase [Candidatus Helarchaeota archaeon]|nr:class I SAM-dependent methyltransferase [Candidatus Helarchaeota archaeon]
MVQHSYEIEQSVKGAFEIIAEDWNRLREKPWPVLIKFLEKFQCLKFFINRYILDLGCGNGRHSLMFADKTDYVIGVDFSFNLLKIAKKKCSSEKIDNVSYIMADITSLPFKNNIFSSSIYLSTFHHIPNRMNRLSNLMEIKRILKTNGYCLISVWRRWQKRFFWYFFKQIFKPKQAREFGDIYIPWQKQNGEIVQRFYHLFTQREMKKLVRKAELQVVLLKNFGGPTQHDNVFIVLRNFK